MTKGKSIINVDLSLNESVGTTTKIRSALALQCITCLKHIDVCMSPTLVITHRGFQYLNVFYIYLHLVIGHLKCTIS